MKVISGRLVSLALLAGARMGATTVAVTPTAGGQSPAAEKRQPDNPADLPMHSVSIQASNIHLALVEISDTYKVRAGLEVSPDDDLLKKHGIVFRLDSGSLSFACNVPIGLEVAQDEDVTANYRLKFEKGTLSDLLTQFVAGHDRYAWRIEGGVVSVFPKEGHRDPLLRELLATEISNFSVKEKTDCQRFAQSLLNTPEVRKTLEGYGLTFDTWRFGGFYIEQLGQRFSLNYSEAQLKSILDGVIKRAPRPDSGLSEEIVRCRSFLYAAVLQQPLLSYNPPSSSSITHRESYS